jgi:ABC-type glycerol-3-phosphate transport system substrate-binding protein
MKNFQIILLIVFGLLAGLAAAFFSGAIKLPTRASQSPTGGATGSVVMWGTISKSQLRDTIDFFNGQAGGGLALNYIEKNPLTYEKDLLDSFAFGGTPDIFILPNNLISLYADKVIVIPYQGFSERMFSDTYIQAAEVFKTEDGILGYPFLSDPLVMFYNKDHFDGKGIVAPPKYWKELSTLVPELTEKNELLEIKKSGVALGESKNIKNFKEILLAMNIQLGNNIVVRDYTKGIYNSTFATKSFISAKPAEETLKFFLEFSNPLKSVYSWNKSMPFSITAFVGGDLSVYFGFASEIPLIQKMNPNLNFDIANIPQVEGSANTLTYSNIYALAIPKTTKNFQGAFYVSSQLANGPLAAPFSLVAGLSPVRRDLLSPSASVTKFSDIYYKSAIASRSWVDPSYGETNKIFGDMVENVLSGLKDYSKSVVDTNTELKALLAK